MRREFHLIQGAVQNDKDMRCFLERMEIATGQGFRIESCGIQGFGSFYAIMSKPATAENRKFGVITQKDMDLVRALAENDMSASGAARELGWNRSTIQKHCDQLYGKTGLDPRKFYDLNELLYMEVKNER